MPRPRRRIPSWRFWTWACLAYVAILRTVAASPDTAPAHNGERRFDVPSLPPGPCEVVEVISGDTFVVRPATSHVSFVVRLLSTQAASVEQDGPELAAAATQSARDFLTHGDVRLRLDNHRLDSHGRYLAYLEARGEMLNLALIEAGLARFYFFPGNSASTDRQLSNAQDAARIARRGIWRTR